MNPILITGGAGSVGKQLTNMLLSEGKSVRVFDLPFMVYSLEDLDNVEIVKGDVTDSNSVTQTVSGVDGFFILLQCFHLTVKTEKQHLL